MTRMFILVIFPLILLLLPANTFDNGHYTICIFKLLTGAECSGCGLSRACMHLIHCDMNAAAYYNKLSFIVLPILCGLLAGDFIRCLRIYRRLYSNSDLKNNTGTQA